MCGIIGIASNKKVSTNIINALKKLEYRGYDSAGLATITNGEINEKKCSGRVEKLEKILLNMITDSGYSGIKFDKKVDFTKLFNEKFNWKNFFSD